MNCGVSQVQSKEQFGAAAVDDYAPVIMELVEHGLLTDDGARLKLTARGRLLSNEVFERFLRENAIRR
jgi:oxygen-independent coproporphyrinogen-3 oxidase